MTLQVLVSSGLLLGGSLDRLGSNQSSVKASSVGLVSERLLDGLLTAKEPSNNLLEHVNDALQQRRLEEGLGELDDEVGDVSKEVRNTGVDEELVDSLVKLGTLLDSSQEGVEVLHQTLKEVDNGSTDLVDVQVDQSVTSVLDKLATSLQKANQEVDVAGEVKEAHGLVALSGKSAGSKSVHGSVLLDELGSIVAGDFEVRSDHKGVGSSQRGGGESGNGDGGEFHCRSGVIVG